ncbi:MAG: hypothetical protein ACFE8N_06240 [Promethearchaeota archaeon]
MAEEKDEVFWFKKLRQHWKILAVAIFALICVITGVILVFIWFVESSPIGAYGEATLNDWTLDWVVGFVILLTLWELLFVGVPTALFFGVGGYLVWRRLPDEEKEEFKAREKSRKRTKEKAGGSGGFGIVMFIAYCLYHGIKGNYYTPFGDYSYSYWLYTMMLTFMWIVIVLGGPVLIIVIILYFTKWRKKKE